MIEQFSERPTLGIAHLWSNSNQEIFHIATEMRRTHKRPSREVAFIIDSTERGGSGWWKPKDTRPRIASNEFHVFDTYANSSISVRRTRLRETKSPVVVRHRAAGGNICCNR
jgi:hypothetical protein